MELVHAFEPLLPPLVGLNENTEEFEVVKVAVPSTEAAMVRELPLV
jgi:hypothetical protein